MTKNIIHIIYKVDNNTLGIFGEEFVKNNKSKCKFIYNNQEYKLTGKIKANKGTLKIKLFSF